MGSGEVAHTSAACGRISEWVSKCCGRHKASLLRQAQLLPGTTNGGCLLRLPISSLARTPASAIDRCHSLRSLYPPLAALPSLPPVAFFGYFLGETRKYRQPQARHYDTALTAYIGDCHTSAICRWFAMTNRTINRNLTVDCFVNL